MDSHCEKFPGKLGIEVEQKSRYWIPGEKQVQCTVTEKAAANARGIPGGVGRYKEPVTYT